MKLISLVMERCLCGRKFYELDTAICRYDGPSESAILDESGKEIRGEGVQTVF